MKFKSTYLSRNVDKNKKILNHKVDLRNRKNVFISYTDQLIS